LKLGPTQNNPRGIGEPYAEYSSSGWSSPENSKRLLDENISGNDSEPLEAEIVPSPQQTKPQLQNIPLGENKDVVITDRNDGGDDSENTLTVEHLRELGERVSEMSTREMSDYLDK